MSTRFINADVIDGLRQIADESVHCVVTSPPYWGLRKYEGVDPSVWGGSATCDHKWGERERGRRGDILPLGESESGRLGTTEAQTGLNDGGQFCDLCGAWLGCLGLEPTADLFVSHIVEVFRHVRRVLHPSGTCWVNLGDNYITSHALDRRPKSDLLRGKSDIERSGYQVIDSVYSDLCDVCLDFWKNRIGSTTCRLSKPLPSEPTGHDIELPDSSSASQPYAVRGVPESTNPESSLQPPDECSHCSNCGACLAVLRSSSRDAGLCGRMALCSPYKGGIESENHNQRKGASASAYGYSTSASLKNKDLVMIPARVAIALQEDGWYLRSQIPWIKRSAMPESSNDRPTSGVEYIFLLAKSETYFYDRVGILQPQAEHERTRRLREQEEGLKTTYSLRRDTESHGQVKAGKGSCTTSVMSRQLLAQTGTRQRRNTDWALESFRGLVTDECGDPLAMMVNPQPFTLDRCITCGTIYTKKEHRKLKKSGDTRACRCGGTEWLSHFATFPEAMVEPCVIAGTSDAGACHYCGAQMQRVVAEKFIPQQDVSAAAGVRPATRDRTTPARRGWEGVPRGSLGWFTKGWEPSCSHPLFPPDPVPSVVLDPFGGSGTVAVVAARHFCDAILIDRSAAYLEMAKFRLEKK